MGTWFFVMSVLNMYRILLLGLMKMQEKRILNPTMTSGMIMSKIMIVVLTILVTGCSTIVRGTTDELIVDTDPRGAKCTTETLKKDKLQAAYSCENTPCTYVVKRKFNATSKCSYNDSPEVVFDHAKYSSHEYYVLGNVIFGGLIGIVVDVVNAPHLNFEKEVIKIE
jgi:hypothetical protein